MSTELDTKCVNAIRVLAMDTVHKANSGHSGAPLGLAPAAHVLWSRFLQFEPDWLNRDRFILSCGHASALIYSMLHIHTRVLSIEDLKQFRQYGAKCAGHPEHHLIHELEATTGALGQGISNAVGFAVAAAQTAARFNKPDCKILTHKTYCFCSDGDLMEGVASEACSFAGHQRLNNLVCLYDDNHITISGRTDIAFTEDVQMRFRAYGWKTIEVKNANEDLDAIEAAIRQANEIDDAPVLIALKTTIGYGSDLADTSKVHGTPLNNEQLAHLKTKFGFNPEESFVVPEEVYKFYDGVRTKTHEKVVQWNALFEEYKAKYPKEYAELDQLIHPNFTVEAIKKFIPMTNEKPTASRVSSGVVLNALADNLPGIVGGSADLTPSNNTGLKNTTVFQPGHREGRYFEFGIREHGMQAMANGMQWYLPGIVPFTATFFVFVQYLLPSVRIAALEHLRTLLVLTHDSIGLGEDGATHQNVENFATLRAMPNCLLFRPADALEVAACYTAALTGPSMPAVFALSRQNLPPLAGSSFDDALKGAYIVKKAENPKLVVIATGSEVDLAIKAAEKVGYPVQVVSMPCTQIFDRQPEEYKRTIIPHGVPVVSVEAAVGFGWERYSHMHVGVETFGLSAPASKVYEHFGLTPDGIASKYNHCVEFYAGKAVPDPLERP